MELIQVATLRDFSQFNELRHYLPGSNRAHQFEEKAGREIILSRTDAKGKPLPGRMLTPPKALVNNRCGLCCLRDVLNNWTGRKFPRFSGWALS